MTLDPCWGGLPRDFRTSHIILEISVAKDIVFRNWSTLYNIIVLQTSRQDKSYGELSVEENGPTMDWRERSRGVIQHGNSLPPLFDAVKNTCNRIHATNYKICLLCRFCW